MSIIEGLIGPIAKLIDKIIPDPEARDRAKLELIKLEGSQEMEAIRTRMTAIVAEANSADPWTSRARPSFLYVMYALLLWAIPMGLIAAARPEMAKGIADGMNAYLAGIPEPLYALFGTDRIGGSHGGQLPVFGHGTALPAAGRDHVPHFLGHLLTGEFCLGKIGLALQHTVGDQVIKTRIRPLNDHGRQAGDRPLRIADDITHHAPESIRGPIELVAHGDFGIKVAATGVGVPAQPQTDLPGLVAPPGRNRHRRGAANLVIQAVGGLGLGAMRREDYSPQRHHADHGAATVPVVRANRSYHR